MRTLALLLLLLLAAPAAAQNLLRADLDGQQEVPPVNTMAGGWATFTLNANNSVTYQVRTWGLTGTAAHIHEAPPGVNGGIIVTLNGGPTAWSGTSAPLTAAQVATLRSGGMYVNVHTAANPGGEIRGQIRPAPMEFAARLTGSQEVPPVSTNAMGTGTFSVSSTGTITYNVTTSGLTGTAAHIHQSPPGVNGGILFTLLGGPTTWSGTTVAMTPAQWNDLQAGNLYANVHTAANPGGEIRGQIFAIGVPYGRGCPPAGGTTPTLSTGGSPMTGQMISVSVAGGVPGGSGTIDASLNPDATLVNASCVRLIAMPFIRSLPVTLDGSGNRTINVRLPNLMNDLTVYAQFTGMSGGSVYNSNGVALTIQRL